MTQRIDNTQIHKISLMEELQEHYRQLEEEGVAVEELTFRFSCQQCGFRCYRSPHIATVELSPHSCHSLLGFFIRIFG